MIFLKHGNKNENCYPYIDVLIPGLEIIILLGRVNLISILHTVRIKSPDKNRINIGLFFFYYYYQNH